MLKTRTYAMLLGAIGLWSCSSDSYTEPKPQELEPEPEPQAITLIGHSNKSAAGSRASASEDAGRLGGEFRVFATSDNDQRVFDNYVVRWVDNPGSNESNVAGWDYLGYLSKAELPAVQSVKYWNLQASRYDFVAFAGLADNQRIESTQSNTLMVNASNMHSLYYADRVSAKAQHQNALKGTEPEYVAYGTTIKFVFRRATSRIRIGFYEVVPGYAVKDLRFYYGDNADAAQGSSTVEEAGLQGMFLTSGRYAISYDAENTVHALLQTDGDMATTDHRCLGKMAYRVAASSVPSKPELKADGTPAAEGEGEQAYIGSTAAQAVYSWSDEVIDGKNEHTMWHPILPHETNTTPLSVHVDYTLVALDGTKEMIKVKGAKATIPLDYCQWKPNYAYTYIFKITSDHGQQLFPITFDATVSEVIDFGSAEFELTNP